MQPWRECTNLYILAVIKNKEWGPAMEIKLRIVKTREAFLKMRKVLCSHDQNLQLQSSMVKCYVFPVLLYGAES